VTDARTEAEIRRYYDELSSSYERDRKHRYHRMVDDLETALVCRYAREARVLELGCGTGLILQRVAKVARDAVGIDLSEGMAQRARERGLDVRIGNVCELPFDDGEFDLTYSFKVLAHVPEVEEALREAARVTKPGGHLVLEFYNPWSLRYLAKRVTGPQRLANGRTESDIPTRWDSPKAVRAMLPPDVELVEFYGVRVLTPFAAVHDLPGLGRALRWAEGRASDSPLRHFGGFMVAIVRRRL